MLIKLNNSSLVNRSTHGQKGAAKKDRFCISYKLKIPQEKRMSNAIR